jgi:hypothetical protein
MHSVSIKPQFDGKYVACEPQKWHFLSKAMW